MRTGPGHLAGHDARPCGAAQGKLEANQEVRANLPETMIDQCTSGRREGHHAQPSPGAAGLAAAPEVLDLCPPALLGAGAVKG